MPVFKAILAIQPSIGGAVLPQHGKQSLLLAGAQVTVASPPQGWAYGNPRQDCKSAQAPFLDGHDVKVAKQGEFQAHGIGANWLSPESKAVQPSITVVGDKFRRQGRKGILTQVLNQRARFMLLAFLGTGLLVGVTSVGQVALESGLERHAFRSAALDIDATHHFVFGAACPVLNMTLGTKDLDGGGPAGLADDGFPATGRPLDYDGHESLQRLKDRHCTETVF